MILIWSTTTTTVLRPFNQSSLAPPVRSSATHNTAKKDIKSHLYELYKSSYLHYITTRMSRYQKQSNTLTSTVIAILSVPLTSRLHLLRTNASGSYMVQQFISGQLVDMKANTTESPYRST